MTCAARKICAGGLLLFVFGLLIGFPVHALPNPHAALSAHLNAVQSGTFLIALGLLWPRFNLGPRYGAALSLATWLSFWGLEAGMVLNAFVSPEAPAALKPVAGVLIAVSAFVMAAAMTLLAINFLRRPAPEAGALKTA